MPPKLAARSKAVRLLREKFESGELSGHEDPKTVWASHDTFKQHKIDNFRTRYNKMRKEYLDGGKEEVGAADLNRTSVMDEARESKKRRYSQRDDMKDAGSEVILIDNEEGDSVPDEALMFKPLALLSTWEEQGSRAKRITLAIVLPSGIGPRNFSLQVIDRGYILQLTVKWPEPLMDLRVMHRMWLDGTERERKQIYHSKILGFEKYLQQLRGRSSGTIESTARIGLPLAVESHIDFKVNLVFRESETKLLYVDLKAAVEDYAVNIDTDDFIVT